MPKENPLYIEVFRQVSAQVEDLPKNAVMHITQMVSMMVEREKQIAEKK